MSGLVMWRSLPLVYESNVRPHRLDTLRKESMSAMAQRLLPLPPQFSSADLNQLKLQCLWNMIEIDRDLTPTNPFKGRQFPGEVIILCVRWYLRYPLISTRLRTRRRVVGGPRRGRGSQLHLAVGANLFPTSPRTLSVWCPIKLA